MQGFFHWLSLRLLRHPLRWLCGGLFITIVFAIWIPRATMDLSFVGIANKHHPLIDRYLKVSKELNLGGLLPLLLSGKDEQALDEAVQKLKKQLPSLASVSRVTSSAPQEWLQQRAPWWVKKSTFEDWLRLATHPDDKASRERLFRRLKALQKEQRSFQKPGLRLLLVRMSFDPMARPLGKNGFAAIAEKTNNITKPLKVKAEYAGFAAIFAQDQKQTLWSVRWLTPISLVLVLFLLLWLERRPLRLLGVAVPLLLSVLATLGILSLWLPVITLGVTFFAVLVFGLGVDFALHWMVRLREEMAGGRAFPLALLHTMKGVGGGITSGALTTAGAFFLISLAPDTMAHHLGLSGGLGLLLCLVAMLTLLPAIWIVLEKSQKTPSIAPPPLQPHFLRRLALLSARHPHAVVGLSLLVMAAAIAGLPRLEYQTDLRRIFNRNITALSTVKRLQKEFGLNPTPWMIPTQNLEEARKLVRRLKQSPRIARVDSLVRLFPADRQQRKKRVKELLSQIRQQQQRYGQRAEKSAGKQAERWMLAASLLSLLERAYSLGLPSPGALPTSLRDSFLTRDGKWVVMASVKEPHLDGHKARQERKEIQAIAPQAVSFHFLLEAVLAEERPWISWVFFGIFVFVLALLWNDFRHGGWVCVALAPVVFGASVTFGVLCWWGLQFNVMSVLIVPLLLGLGVDDGIHVVHRLRSGESLGVADKTASVGQAILLTTLTTMLSVSTLLLTGHAGLEGMAIVMLVGLPLCLLASVTILPALAVLWKLVEDKK